MKGDTTFRLSSYFKNVSLGRSKLGPVENQEKIAMKSWLKVSCFFVQIFSTEIEKTRVKRMSLEWSNLKTKLQNVALKFRGASGCAPFIACKGAHWVFALSSVADLIRNLMT